MSVYVRVPIMKQEILFFWKIVIFVFWCHRINKKILFWKNIFKKYFIFPKNDDHSIFLPFRCRTTFKFSDFFYLISDIVRVDNWYHKNPAFWFQTWHFNSSHDTDFFLFTLKASENQRFSDVFRGYRKRHDFMIFKEGNIWTLKTLVLMKVFLLEVLLQVLVLDVNFS